MFPFSQYIKKLRTLFLSKYVYLIYYLFILSITFITIVSALFPYPTQNLFYKFFDSAFTRIQILRIVFPHNSEYDRKSILSLINELKQKNKKIAIKEIECEKNISPAEMLIKGKGDLAIISSTFCLLYRNQIKAISSAGEKTIYIIAPKNYGFEEFQMLAGKKIGFVGDVHTAMYITERLIQFYHFDIPPELNKEPIHDIEKSFSNGEIEVIVWADESNSPYVREFLSKKWYQIVPVQQAVEFSKTIPGLCSRTLNILSYGPQELICIKNILAVSHRVSNPTVREVIRAWFTSEFILHYPEYTPTHETFLPPAFLDIHPIAFSYFNKNRPITQKELKTLGISFVFLLIAFLLLRQLFQFWIKRKNKHYEKELKKIWDEIKYLKYQWNVELSNQEILIRLKKIKSIYNWALESYKQNFTSEKELILIYLNILHQLLEFNERYFEYLNKKLTISETLSIQEQNKEIKPLQKVPILPIDEKDKYLKTPPSQTIQKEQEQQMLLFNLDKEI